MLEMVQAQMSDSLGIIQLLIREINVGDFWMVHAPFIVTFEDCSMIWGGGFWPAMELVFYEDNEYKLLEWVSLQ